MIDADLRPVIAVPACGLGLDVVSVHEVELGESPDDQSSKGPPRRGGSSAPRTRTISSTGRRRSSTAPHVGVLIVPTALSVHRPERVARALKR